MVGGMLTISAAILGDAYFSRSRAAFLGFSYMALLTLYAFALCGLLELFFPRTPPTLLRVLQVALGPVCCAVALGISGRWLNAKADDGWIFRALPWFMHLMVLGAAALALVTLLLSPEYQSTLLVASAAICFATVGYTGACSLQAYRMGDRLAIWIAPTAVAMAIAILGLYSQAMRPGSLTEPATALTVCATIAYVLMIGTLSIMRTRKTKRLERLAGLHIGTDPATGLPTGSALIAKVDDSFWRSARNGMACNVVCMHLHNLYELGDVAGHGVENQIALTMSARIRRAVGFRCVVGLYHARCFVVVIPVQAESSPVQIQNYVQRLRYLISKPLMITGQQRTQHAFEPDWGIAVVSATAQNHDSGSVLRQAERMAMQDGATAPAPLADVPTTAA